MASEATYDAFLSHSTPDKPAVERLALRLKAEGLRPFLDKWHLVPGEPWQEAIEKAMDRSRTCVVFIGPGPLGPWQNEEMRNALAVRVRDDSRRVIPVLLPGASMPELPPFLARLTWVDFRTGLDDPLALHRLFCGVRGIEPETGPAGTESLPPLVARPIMIGVPHRNPFFTGREALLSHLHQQLQTQGISALAQAALHGLGGIGKTQTAIEYAHRFGEHYRFVLWAMAEEETALRSAYLSVARELRLVEAQADLETAVLTVKAWLSREGGWLLVFDNADDPSLVRAYLPPTRTGGQVLLTSRAKSFAKVGIKEPFRVETLEPREAVKFLIERSGHADAEAAAQLAAELGYLPLALEQAAAYIETVGGGFAEYLARYRRQGVALLTKGEPSTDYPKTIATTWTLSFVAVRKTSPGSAELLTAAAFLVPDSVPVEIFSLGGSELGDLLTQDLKGAPEDPLVFWELLEPLERYSLVERSPNDAFKLHRLTQEVIKASLGEAGRRSWAERIVIALNAAYPTPEFENWKLCERLQPHARRVSELTRTYRLKSAEAGRLFNKAGYFAWSRGDYINFKSLTGLSLEILDHVQGSEDPDTLIVRNNLAEALRVLGDLAAARELHEQNFQILVRVRGGEHADTLMSRISLAETIRACGDLTGAKQLHEQTLEILERTIGDEDHYTLQCRNNLAAVLNALGDVEGARQLYEKNLEIRERVMGVEHPETLRSRSNLAEVFVVLGDFARARQLHEQILDARERVIGTEHPDTLTSRSNLAKTLYAMGDLPGAKKLEEDTLAIQERELGAEHPSTLISRNNLAQFLGSLGDLVGARRLSEQNLEIHERVLGFEHPDTLHSRHNLACILYELHDFTGARKLFEQIQETRARVLGDQHPDTTNSTWNLFLTVRELYDSEAQAQLITKLRWLLERDEGSILSAIQRTIRQRLSKLLNPS